MDVPPPVTQAVIISGVPRANDYFRSPVTIDLVASDPDNAPNTLRTFYQVDGRGFHEGKMVTVGDGIHVLQYFSVDPSNNFEKVHTQIIRVDTTTPVVTAAASPTILWPPNNKLVPVTVMGHISDASGGVPGAVVYHVLDEYGQVQPSGSASVNAQGNYSFTVELQASRLGQDMDERLYTIVVAATDEAGNTGTALTHVTVPYDQGQQASKGQGNGHAQGNAGHGLSASVVPSPGESGSGKNQGYGKGHGKG
jgi:hypothetical protein